MTRIVFRWGREVKETTLKPGLRLYNAGYLLGYDEIGFGDCGGSCVCSTCHVRVLAGLELFPAMKREEHDLLDTLPQVHENSRLACQLVIPDGIEMVEVEWVG